MSEDLETLEGFWNGLTELQTRHETERRELEDQQEKEMHEFLKIFNPSVYNKKPSEFDEDDPRATL